MNQLTGPQPLTPKEKNILQFLEAYIGQKGTAPSFLEIKEHFGFASFNSVQRYLKQLEEKSYIHVPGGNRKRAITLLHPASTIQSNVVSMTEYREKRNETLMLPLLGKVAAGQPIEALHDNEFVDIPASFVKHASRSYALQVQGDSMIEDGIHNGDIILVQEQKHANSGEIVVAMIENEATVKRYYPHKSRPLALHDSNGSGPQVELRPANSSMHSLWYRPDEVEIRGVVVGLLRRYF